VHRFTRWPKPVLAACAGVLAAVGVAGSLTQAATTAPAASTTSTATTPTTTTTTPTTTTPATPTPAKPKASSTTKQVKCKAALVATQLPIDSAENFGTLTCSVPFGAGVQHDTSTVTRISTTSGSFAGGVKLFFNTGTLRGTYKSSFSVANKTITYTGTLKISSGTGDFQGVTGKGTLTGTSTDVLHSAITERLTLKIPPKKKS
jgi:hypothetical protein